MIEIDYNGTLESFSGNTLMDLVNQKELNHKTGVAIAINNEVVSKTKWSEFILKANDKILVITAAAGG
jgi:sulfur carrier protein